MWDTKIIFVFDSLGQIQYSHCLHSCFNYIVKEPNVARKAEVTHNTRQNLEAMGKSGGIVGILRGYSN